MKPWSFLALFAALPVVASAQTLPAPPVAEQRPYMVKGPLERNDEYYWLRDDTRKNPAMLAYLNAENAYADAYMQPLKPLENRIYSEIVGRIKQDDASVPVRERGYFYYSRYRTGEDYPVVARKRGSLNAREEILLDQPKMAKGHGFFSISDWDVSQDNRLLAYAQDVVGRRQYVLRVQNLATGALLPDTVENVEANLVWADDNRTLYYIEKNPVTPRSERVKAHVLGTPASADRLIYEEMDNTFYVAIGRTSDDAACGRRSEASKEHEFACGGDRRARQRLDPHLW